MNFNVTQNIKSFFSQKSALPRLMLVNIAVFVVVLLGDTFAWLMDGSWFNEFVVKWFAVSSDTEVLSARFWTLGTYMFIHSGFWHLFFNMVMLYFGGVVFLQYLSEKNLLYTYLLGGLTGAVFFVAAYNTFPVFNGETATVVGASASVMAIIVAAAAYMPDYNVNLFLFGRIRLKYLALIFVAIDLLSITRGNAGGHIAHLGGAAYGLVYGLILSRGLEFGKFFRRHPRMKVHRNTDARNLTDEDYNRNKADNQEKIDAILDKIAKNGYSSLSKEEKDFLFKNSR